MEGKTKVQKKHWADRSSSPLTFQSAEVFFAVFVLVRAEAFTGGATSKQLESVLFLFRTSEVISHASNGGYILDMLWRMTS